MQEKDFAQNFFHKIDLFDFTSFFRLDFLKLFWLTVPYSMYAMSGLATYMETCYARLDFIFKSRKLLEDSVRALEGWRAPPQNFALQREELEIFTIFKNLY